MNWRPGRGLLAIGWLCLALGGACFWLPSAARAIPLVLLAGAVLCYVDARKLKGLLAAAKVERIAPAAAGRDRLFRVRLRLTAPGALRGELRERLPDVALPSIALFPVRFQGQQELEFEYQAAIPERGRHRLGPAWLRLEGPLGMLESQRELAGDATIRILPPSLVDAEELAMRRRGRQELLDKKTMVRRVGQGTEFETLTEYRPWDDPRRIDWRSSARMRRLLVRRFQIEQHRDLLLLVDCGRLMGAPAVDGTKLDAAIDAALRLARTALERGDRTGLGIFDDRVRGYLPPTAGPGAFNALVEALHDVRGEGRESDFTAMFALLQRRRLKRTLVIVLSDFVDAETTQRYRAALAGLAARHVVLFAALRTPLLVATVEAPLAEERDIARKAVAFRLMRERERALHSLQRAGIEVLDVEPSDLTIPLVNRYIVIREQNRL